MPARNITSMVRTFLLTAVAFFGMAVAANAQTSTTGMTGGRSGSKVGVNTSTPTENLDVNGTIRVRTLPADKENKIYTTTPTGTAADPTAATNPDQVFNQQYVVTADANGVLGRAPGAQPIFFYMPAMVVPTTMEQAGTNEYDATTHIFTIDLYQNYAKQFALSNATMVSSTRVVSNTAVQSLPGMTSPSSLDYFVTYFDDSVFEEVSLTTDGKLKYKVKTGANVTAKTFMNIVFLAK